MNYNYKVVVGYGAPYAAIVHENVNGVVFRVGKEKFLEEYLTSNEDKIREIYQKNLKQNIEKGIKKYSSSVPEISVAEFITREEYSALPKMI